MHWQLTGHKVLGVGDASGMFPIDSTTGGYDAAMLQKFNTMAAAKGYAVDLNALLPEVLPAGADAGTLTEAVPACWTPPAICRPVFRSARRRATPEPAWPPPTAWRPAPAMSAPAPAFLPWLCWKRP